MSPHTAQEYDKLTKDREFKQKIYQEIINEVNDLKSKKILDLATGTGHLAEKIDIDTFFGIDIDLDRIELANKKQLNANFIYANAEHMPFRSENIDLVAAIMCVHHILNPYKVFSEVSRVLKKNSKFMIFDILGSDNKKLNEKLKEAIYKNTNEEKPYSRDDIHKFIELANLKIAHQDIWEINIENMESESFVKKFEEGYNLISDKNLQKIFEQEFFKRENGNYTGKLKFINLVAEKESI